MKTFKYLALAAVAAACFTATAPKVEAQVVIRVGVAPECPYGYYDYDPYPCAPYGYYGPEWFTGGIFIGAGPWFRGHGDFRGHVDNHYDAQRGYHGPMPARGERADPSRRPERVANFKGNEMRDGRGHVSSGDEHGHDDGHDNRH
jgi:hypothetical protein